MLIFIFFSLVMLYITSGKPQIKVKIYKRIQIYKAYKLGWISPSSGCVSWQHVTSWFLQVCVRVCDETTKLEWKRERDHRFFHMFKSGSIWRFIISSESKEKMTCLWFSWAWVNFCFHMTCLVVIIPRNKKFMSFVNSIYWPTTCMMSKLLQLRGTLECWL